MYFYNEYRYAPMYHRLDVKLFWRHIVCKLRAIEILTLYTKPLCKISWPITLVYLVMSYNGCVPMYNRCRSVLLQSLNDLTLTTEFHKDHGWALYFWLIILRLCLIAYCSQKDCMCMVITTRYIETYRWGTFSFLVLVSPHLGEAGTPCPLCILCRK